MRVIQFILSILFLIILSAPMIIMGTVGNEVFGATEKFEKRKLARFPKKPKSISDIASTSEQFERYINDHFGFRLPLVRLHSYLTYYLFGDSPRDNVILGKEGWFFRGRGLQRSEQKRAGETYDSISTLHRSLPEETLSEWASVISERHALLKEHGIQYVFAIAPKKALLYPEYLPTPLQPKPGHKSRIEQVTEYLKANTEVPVADVIGYLRQQKSKDPETLLYLKTDGHWNQIGAYYAYRSIIETLIESTDNRKIQPIPLDSFKLRWKKGWSHKGFTSQLGVEVTENYPQLKPKPQSPLQKIYQFRPKEFPFDTATIKEKERGVFRVDLQNSDKQSLRYSYAQNPLESDYRSILLTGDSFLQKCLHYFRPHATHLLRLRTELSMDTHFLTVPEELKPQLVIQEVAQRYIGLRPPE